MKRVDGIGGMFFKSKDPEKMYQWYEKHLGIKRGMDGHVSFMWRDTEDPEKQGMTVWSIFKNDTAYFEPSKSTFMVNYRVQDLDGLLEALRQEGVEIDPKREDLEYGKFAWIMDPDGNRIELWQPPEV